MRIGRSKQVLLALAVATGLVAASQSTVLASQVTIKPEILAEDPRVNAIRKRLTSGALKHRRLDTYVDVRIVSKRKEEDAIKRILFAYMSEVGLEPIDSLRAATFRLEISSNQSAKNGVIQQTLNMILFDRSLSQGERPIMQSRTDLQCNEFVYGRDYRSFAPPRSTCVREEAQLREAFLRLR